MTVNATVRGAAWPRLVRFVRDVFPPKTYFTYAVLWVLALEGSLAVLDSGRWSPSASTVVRVVSVGLALLYLRMVDELKDLDYDREHNPQRPLVRGSITAVELRRWVCAIAVVLVGANALVSLASAGVLALSLGHALLLVLLERWSPWLRDSLFPNLVITYPVQILLSVYVCVSAGGGRAVPVALVASFSFVFLHFEFARKTARSTEPQARMYSNLIGPVGSGSLALAAPCLAAVFAVALFRPWQIHGAGDLARLLPYFALTLPAFGAWRFFTGERAWPAKTAMAFILAWYAALVCQAVVVSLA